MVEATEHLKNSQLAKTRCGRNDGEGDAASTNDAGERCVLEGIVGPELIPTAVEGGESLALAGGEVGGEGCGEGVFFKGSVRVGEDCEGGVE